MKAELTRVRFLNAVSPLTSNDVDTAKQRHLRIFLRGGVVEIHNSMAAAAYPIAYSPTSNVAFFLVKPSKPDFLREMLAADPDQALPIAEIEARLEAEQTEAAKPKGKEAPKK